MNAQQLLTRRAALLRLGTASLLGLGLWPGCHAPRATSGGGRTFRFIAVNDLHHASNKCDEWFAALVRQMRAHEGIELVLLLGDLADTGKEEDLAAIRDHFRRLKMPCYSVIGNHDYLTATDRRAYEQIFPRQLNYCFQHRGWQFVGLDSTRARVGRRRGCNRRPSAGSMRRCRSSTGAGRWCSSRTSRSARTCA